MRERLGWLVVAVVIVGAGLGVRQLGGQDAGTALYAALIYVLLFVVAPRLRPVVAGVAATGICWAIELFQLTPFPGMLAERSVLAALVLGSHFDVNDLLWYPVGVWPLVGLHLLWTRRPST